MSMCSDMLILFTKTPRLNHQAGRRLYPVRRQSKHCLGMSLVLGTVPATHDLAVTLTVAALLLHVFSLDPCIVELDLFPWADH